MQLINHYSMVWFGIFVFGLVAFFLLRDGFKSSDAFVLSAVLVGLSSIWLVLRPERGQLSPLAEVGQGQAVLMELQSPF
jgi:hypothetical protein